MNETMVWEQFRRLLLGTMVEVLVAEGVAIEFSTVKIAFDRDSEFKVPRLDNYMRFKGAFEAKLSAGTTGLAARLDGKLSRVWPEILQVLEIPIGDKLTLEKNEVTVEDAGGHLRVRFDLVAD